MFMCSSSRTPVALFQQHGRSPRNADLNAREGGAPTFHEQYGNDRVKQKEAVRMSIAGAL
jgi:hypothetical protein